MNRLEFLGESVVAQPTVEDLPPDGKICPPPGDGVVTNSMRIPMIDARRGFSALRTLVLVRLRFHFDGHFADAPCVDTDHSELREPYQFPYPVHTAIMAESFDLVKRFLSHSQRAD